MGNANLKLETSINKEIGIEFNKSGWQASATYFHNAYRNKIVIGERPLAINSIFKGYKKYLVVGGVFTIYMLFFDNASFLVHRNMNSELDKLTRQKQFLQKESWPRCWKPKSC